MHLALARHTAYETSADDAAPRVVVLESGRERSVTLPAGMVAVAVCLQGTLEVHSAFGLIALMENDLFVGVLEQPLRTALRGGACALVLTLPLDAVRGRMSPGSPRRTGEPVLFTEVYRGMEAVSDAAWELRRNSVTHRHNRAVDQLIEHVLDLDRCFDERVARSPGRTESQRRQTLARFERTRNRMRFGTNRDLDVVTLARQTNYTRSHFVRLFCQIYQTAPAAYLDTLRRETCERLLATPTLAIHEVAALSGFASPAAFSRWFRASYGQTASDWRARHPMTAPALHAVSAGATP